MTVDHRIYLRPGVDLVTAEDAAEWLRQFVAGVRLDLDTGMIHDVNADDVAAELEARLDRERKQAFRRGALAAWRRAAVCMREASDTRGCRRDLAMIYAVWEDRWPPSNVRRMLDDIALALAFRAAARAR